MVLEKDQLVLPQRDGKCPPWIEHSSTVSPGIPRRIIGTERRFFWLLQGVAHEANDTAEV